MIICYWQLSKVLVVLVDEPSSYLPAKCITVCIRNTYIYVIYTYSEVYASDEWWSSERSFELSLTKYEIWKCGIQKHKIGKYAFAWFLSGFEELLLGQLVRRRLKPHKHKILDQRHSFSLRNNTNKITKEEQINIKNSCRIIGATILNILMKY